MLFNKSDSHTGRLGFTRLFEIDFAKDLYLHHVIRFQNPTIFKGLVQLLFVEDINDDVLLPLVFAPQQYVSL